MTGELERTFDARAMNEARDEAFQEQLCLRVGDFLSAVYDGTGDGKQVSCIIDGACAENEYGNPCVDHLHVLNEHVERQVFEILVAGPTEHETPLRIVVAAEHNHRGSMSSYPVEEFSTLDRDEILEATMVTDHAPEHLELALDVERLADR